VCCSCGDGEGCSALAHAVVSGCCSGWVGGGVASKVQQLLLLLLLLLLLHLLQQLFHLQLLQRLLLLVTTGGRKSGRHYCGGKHSALVNCDMCRQCKGCRPPVCAPPCRSNTHAAHPPGVHLSWLDPAQQHQQLSGISSKLLHVFENLAATCTAEITRATSRLLLLLSRSRRLRQHAGPACSSSSTTSDAAAAASSALIITTAAAVVAAAATVAAAAAAATRVAVTAGVGFTGICSSSGGSRCRAFNCCDSS
jgi:hypothetical protein